MSIQILKPCVLKGPLLEKYSKDVQKIMLILHFITTITKKCTYFLDNLACHFLNVSFYQLNYFWFLHSECWNLDKKQAGDLKALYFN